MGERPTGYRGRDGRWTVVYLCDHCKKPFEWGPGCSWLGSIKDMEDCEYKRLTYSCSPACHEAMSDGRGIPGAIGWED